MNFDSTSLQPQPQINLNINLNSTLTSTQYSCYILLHIEMLWKKKMMENDIRVKVMGCHLIHRLEKLSVSGSGV